jgi:hypothetical protein
LPGSKNGGSRKPAADPRAPQPGSDRETSQAPARGVPRLGLWKAFRSRRSLHARVAHRRAEESRL